MKIALATTDDVTEILELWDANCKEFGDAELSRDERERVANMLHRAIADEQNLLLKAVDAQAMISAYCLSSVYTDSRAPRITMGSIDEVFVRVTERNRGLGRQLAAEALAWLGPRTSAPIRINVDPDNQNAQRFWEQAGACKEFVTYAIRPESSGDEEGW